MKQALWVRSVRRFVLPHLPGHWDTSPRGFLYRQPADWLLCCVALHNGGWPGAFRHDTIVQLLSVSVHVLGGGQVAPLGNSLLQTPENLDAAEPAMAELTELIRQQAIPLFDHAGTVEHYAHRAEQRVAEYPDNVNDWEEVFCLRLLRGDIDGALEAADATSRAGRAGGEPWAITAAQRVEHTAAIARDNPTLALDTLRRYAGEMRTYVKITEQ